LPGWVTGGSKKLEKHLLMLSNKSSNYGSVNIEDKTDEDVVIKFSNLSKLYEIYERPEDRIKQILYPRFQRLIGMRPKKYFRDFWALNNVSFEVKKGETVGVIGRNGAGKSTLLQIICGTLSPTEGAIETHGRVAALLELGSGFNPDFTGRENVYMNAAILGLTKEEINTRFDEIIAFADIGDFVEQPVKSYSSGMLLRLAFAVIAHVDADILIIDEALAVGDVFFVQKCMRFLKEFMKVGTVLFVSHDTSAVLNFCQKAIWLDKGVVRGAGSPKEISEGYMAELYETAQGESIKLENAKTVEDEEGSPTPERDMRLDFINQTNLRNDIEVFSFNIDKPSFGKGEAKIIAVVLQDEYGQPLSWVVGGENVRLVIRCESYSTIIRPIIGFEVKDRLGQQVFVDNTFLTYVDRLMPIPKDKTFEAAFDFIMPVMPNGDYTISAAIADGLQDEHVQHHWIHDAIAFKVHTTSVCFGAVGIPMRNIEIGIL
jgi:lipopolysaccharide transport system ATP-binding protein